MALSPDDIAERWPEAVTHAKDLREVFGDGVRLLYAKDKESGEEIRRPYRVPQTVATT